MKDPLGTAKLWIDAAAWEALKQERDDAQQLAAEVQQRAEAMTAAFLELYEKHQELKKRYEGGTQ